MRRPVRLLVWLLVLGAGNAFSTVTAGADDRSLPTFPAEHWSIRTPDDAGLLATNLHQFAAYLGGRGMIVRGGVQVFSWGDVSQRVDIASAAKPFFTHFLFRAIELGRLRDPDVKLTDFEPRLTSLNPALEFKDRFITFRHCATQTSGYGVNERPGAAFDYNDFQMALFWDTLFLRVYGATAETVDRDVFEALLARPLGCEDQPTMLAFNRADRAGRIAISVRDHCRFGLLYLRQGRWPGTDGGVSQLLRPEHIRLATTSPLSLSLPRTQAQAAEMLPAQRTLGSQRVPDDQTDHLGCYSWLWWVNGVRSGGKRLWPGAPADTFCALGHANGKRGLAIIPSLDLVMAWNDTTLDARPWRDQVNTPHPLNEAFRLLVAAVKR